MEFFGTYFKNRDLLELFIGENRFERYRNENILVQIYYGTSNFQSLSEIMECLQGKLPSCHIIGATSAGNIFNGEVTRANAFKK